MAKENIRTIEVPKGVEVFLEEAFVRVKGKKGELKRELTYPQVVLKKDGDKIVISSESQAKEFVSIVGTYESHIKNMIKGVSEGYTASMKAVYAHFPVSIKQVGRIVEVNNFLGEKTPRVAKVNGNVKINIQKDIVTIEGINKEEVGQTAANIEQATRIRKKDIRVFQDGVYITQKP